jgi:hypothetical protein
MMNNNFSIAELDTTSLSNKQNKSTLEKPDPVAVSDFKQAMSQGALSSDTANAVEGDSPVAKGDGASKSGDEQMQKILMMLIELLAMLAKSMQAGSEGEDTKSGSAKGNDAVQGGGSGKGETSGKGEGGEKPAKVENGNIVAENNVAAGDGQIPKPTEHKQLFELGGKQVTIGGDGSASASEVQQTKNTLTNLYENSPTFKQMLDSSPNDAFEVSVGKRDDNMSWGNADGRVFMNVKNITAGANDGFEALTAHEFGHAGVGMQHGAEMRQFEQRVAREA